MSPDEFEYAQEQLELAYERGQIGKLTFTRRMKELGFSTDTCRRYFDEIEDRKAAMGL